MFLHVHVLTGQAIIKSDHCKQISRDRIFCIHYNKLCYLNVFNCYFNVRIQRSTDSVKLKLSGRPKNLCANVGDKSVRLSMITFAFVHVCIGAGRA